VDFQRRDWQAKQASKESYTLSTTRFCNESKSSSSAYENPNKKNADHDGTSRNDSNRRNIDFFFEFQTQELQQQ
jgi:hypothetical protein